MPTIFDALPSYPLLTAAEEVHLATLIQAGAADGATPGQKRAGKRAKDRMMLANMRLVINQCKKVSRTCNAGYGFEDLFQEGMVGLHRAAEKFDPARGYKFSTYAFWWIRQALTRAFPTYGTTIRASIHLHERRRVISKWIAEVSHARNKPPTIHETAAQFNVTLKELSAIMNCANTLRSLDAPSGIAEDSSLHEILPDERSEIEIEVDPVELGNMMTCLDLLPEFDRSVLQKTYLDPEPASLSEIARERGCSRERIRQIRDKALRQIRRRMEQPAAEAS